jgi:hypothetical protein
MDDTLYGSNKNGEKVYIHNVPDLGSLYICCPLSGPFANGAEVAEHLSEQFRKHGAPLVMKRDNHSNLNNTEVDRVLGENLVIPLNSPPAYPPYNGAVEHLQGEMKRCMTHKGADADQPVDEFQAISEAAAHELNHKGRDRLVGRTSCQMFALRNSVMKSYTRQKRREVYDQIKQIAATALAATGHSTRRAAQIAWRFAVETWLRRNRYITVSVAGKVLPYSY